MSVIDSRPFRCFLLLFWYHLPIISSSLSHCCGWCYSKQEREQTRESYECVWHSQLSSTSLSSLSPLSLSLVRYGVWRHPLIVFDFIIIVNICCDNNSYSLLLLTFETYRSRSHCDGDVDGEQKRARNERALLSSERERDSRIKHLGTVFLMSRFVPFAACERFYRARVKKM